MASNKQYILAIDQSNSIRLSDEANLFGKSLENPINKCRIQRLFGVSSETYSSTTFIPIKETNLSLETKQLITSSIKDNQFLNELEPVQKLIITNNCYELSFAKNTFIIKEGESGDNLYFINEGTVCVYKSNVFIKKMHKGECFGEISMLYDCPRTATVIAETPLSVLTIKRSVFQLAIRQFDKIYNCSYKILKKIFHFSHQSDDNLKRIISSSKTVNNLPKEIIKLNLEEFYIVLDGSIVVYYQTGKKMELPKGSYITIESIETYLKDINKMNANEYNGCCLLSINIEHLDKCYSMNIDAKNMLFINNSFKNLNLLCLSGSLNRCESNLFKVNVDRFSILKLIGNGLNSSIYLVNLQNEKNQNFALKKVRKDLIVKRQQQNHFINERTILLNSCSPFIIKLFKTYRDRYYIYYLMEYCDGGDLWYHLRKKQRFDIPTTIFYLANTIEALTYLHTKNIVFRDLKPENIVVCQTGYTKLIDFEFSKKLVGSDKTFTFCGTPEYLPPEIILNKGHDIYVDCWSLGILTYEFITGRPPISREDPLEIYKLIINDSITKKLALIEDTVVQSFIKQLCRKNPKKRLNFISNSNNNVRKHKLFDKFKWNDLKSLLLTPPFYPESFDEQFNVNGDSKNGMDDSNYSKSIDEDPFEEITGWDYDFTM